MNKKIKICVLLVFTVSLASCGQKGPLQPAEQNPGVGIPTTAFLD